MNNEVILNLKNLIFNKEYYYIKSVLFFSEYLYLIIREYSWKMIISTRYEIVVETSYNFILRLVLLISRKVDLRFNKISDIVVYDRPRSRFRYLVSYIFSNSDREMKLRVRFWTDARYTIINSISELIYSSNWAEREAMDLFGLKFLGHNDLRRILGDYGLWGFPGRKDFPLVGLYSYFYVVNFLRVFRVRGMLSDFWSIYFQKKIYSQC